MKTTTGALRRGLGGVFAACAVGGVIATTMAAPGAPSATAATDPCAASQVARTIGSVATSTGNYLDTHPETNTALTTISQQQSGPQSLAALKTYFDANPQAAKDMQALQSPLAGLAARCQLPLTLPQLLGLLQGAQSSAGSLPGGLPGAQPTAQPVGVPGTSLPAQPSPAAAVTPGTGPLPGPSTTNPR
ncbi:hemophore [Mycobacterium antarcticum]|uniref:hemophore n=1 Tax=Mycolicibacterium sp. TUM20985 TaxID=3023370 RepID=UPI0025739254|nr:hemophore [Mycolicibacterium sp. TUM20985]BDX34891.1 hemophore [Mycolicibacterium sp. TUM20985]